MDTENRNIILKSEECETLLELDNVITLCRINKNNENIVVGGLKEYKDSIGYMSKKICDTENDIETLQFEHDKKVGVFRDYKVIQDLVNRPSSEMNGLKERLRSLINQRKKMFDTIFEVRINR